MVFCLNPGTLPRQQCSRVVLFHHLNRPSVVPVSHRFCTFLGKVCLRNKTSPVGLGWAKDFQTESPLVSVVRLLPSGSLEQKQKAKRQNLGVYPPFTQRESQESKYPPGKLPFALELDFILNHPVTDAALAVLVLVNCLMFALQTLDVGQAVEQALLSYERNISLVFLFEYFGRWYGKGLSPRYLLSRGMLIDFVAVVPLGFAVADQSEAIFVRLLRLSRILRLQRVVMDTDAGKEMMGSMTTLQVRLANIGFSLFSLLYVSAGFFYQVEKDINPNVLNFFDAFYFALITLFTVGTGEITPLTSTGRLRAVLVPYQLSEIERVRKLSQQIDVKSDRSSERSPEGALRDFTNDSIECKRCHLRGHQSDARFCRNCGALITKRFFDKVDG